SLQNAIPPGDTPFTASEEQESALSVRPGLVLLQMPASTLTPARGPLHIALAFCTAWSCRYPGAARRPACLRTFPATRGRWRAVREFLTALARPHRKVFPP